MRGHPSPRMHRAYFAHTFFPLQPLTAQSWEGPMRGFCCIQASFRGIYPLYGLPNRIGRFLPSTLDLGTYLVKMQKGIVAYADAIKGSSPFVCIDGMKLVRPTGRKRHQSNIIQCAKRFCGACLMPREYGQQWEGHAQHAGVLFPRPKSDSRGAVSSLLRGYVRNMPQQGRQWSIDEEEPYHLHLQSSAASRILPSWS